MPSKRFAGVQALSDVSLDLHPGSVHALVGENGAGKSTLIKLMTGVYHAGQRAGACCGARRSSFSSPRAAQQAGIATIYQEVHLAPQLSRGPQLLPRAASSPGSARSTCGG